jgi:hypothetical protein
MFYLLVGGVSDFGSIQRAARRFGHCDMILDQLPGRDNIVTGHTFTVPLQPLQMKSVRSTRYDMIMCQLEPTETLSLYEAPS